MNRQAFELGFVNQCLSEGFTIKEASILFKIATTPTVKTPPIKQLKPKSNEVLDPTPKLPTVESSKSFIPPAGAYTPTQAPHFNMPIEKVPL